MPVSIKGSGGGSVTLDAGAAAADTTLTLPNVSGTVALTASPTFSGTLTATTITSPASTALTIQSAGTTAMTVSTAQKILMGTTTAASGGGVVQTIVGQGSNDGGIQLTSGTGVSGGGIAINSLAGGGVKFFNFTGNAGSESYTESMRIDTSGNLLVGTTSRISSGKVSVASSETGYSTTISGGAGVGVGLDIQRTTANGDVCYFRSTTGLAGYITVTGASTCTYNQVSDYRLKENFVSIQNGLSTINQLSPFTYTWKADGTVGEGFIAHELQAIIPFAVTGEKDALNVDGSIRPQGVDYSKIVVHLVAAIQELSAKNDALEARIAALEAK
jgi:hypothetical protein